MAKYRVVAYKNGLYIARPDTIWATRDTKARKGHNKEGLLKGEYWTLEKVQQKFFFCGDWVHYGGKFKKLSEAYKYMDDNSLQGSGAYDDMP
jgi:hypothetical protein